jgi:hypothetical protein
MTTAERIARKFHETYQRQIGEGVAEKPDEIEFLAMVFDELLCDEVIEPGDEF